MIRIVINNSYSQVLGLDRPKHKSLAKALSYKINPTAAFFSSDRSGGTRYLIDRHGRFPTGLLRRVEEHFRGCKLLPMLEDNRIAPRASQELKKAIMGVKPYPCQAQAVMECLRRHRGTVTMPTGSGKSITMAMLVAKLGLKTLIVVPNLELKRQLTETFKSLKVKATIENIQSPNLASLTNFDCLIIDEAHHAAAATYRELNRDAWGGIYHRYFFTATPFRGQTEEQILFESIAGQVIYRLTYKQAVEDGIITPVEAYYYDLPKQEVDGYTWNQVYKELVVDHDHRNRLIQEILLNLQAHKASVLCLVKEIRHGDNLMEGYMDSFPFAHGENEETNALIKIFNKGSSCLIGTTGVLGEGVDTKPCEYIILAGLGKSKPGFMQVVGRGFRRWEGKATCKIILFRDRSHKWTLSHFREQVKILKDEYGIVPIKLDLPPGF